MNSALRPFGETQPCLLQTAFCTFVFNFCCHQSFCVDRQTLLLWDGWKWLFKKLLWSSYLLLWISAQLQIYFGAKHKIKVWIVFVKLKWPCSLSPNLKFPTLKYQLNELHLTYIYWPTFTVLDFECRIFIDSIDCRLFFITKCSFQFCVFFRID